jgi:hypothetical protein
METVMTRKEGCDQRYKQLALELAAKTANLGSDEANIGIFDELNYYKSEKVPQLEQMLSDM